MSRKSWEFNHNQRSKTVEERFWEKVDKSGDCWEWVACKDKDGYGFFRHEGKNKKAHRFLFYLEGSDIPSGMLVLHNCDNPSCVNPDHLYIGNNSDNQIDAAYRGRRKQVKLNPDKVREIRKLRSQGVSGPKIAKMYEVSTHTIYAIEHRTKWAYVD